MLLLPEQGLSITNDDDFSCNAVLTGFARKVSLIGLEAFSAISAYLCDLCVNISDDYS
jgi:hypothetical protein